MDEDDLISKTRRKKVLIMGGGIIGLSSAYFLSKLNKYDISLLEKNFPITGASIQNAGTITLSSYAPWTTVNIWGVIKENLLMYKNPTSVLKYSLIFDKDFRYFLRKFMQNRTEDSISKGCKSILELGKFSISYFDDVVSEITSNNPDEVEYHDENFVSTNKGCSQAEVEEQIKKYKKVNNYGGKFINLTLNSTTDEEDSAAKYYDSLHHSGIFNNLSSAY
jgi:hypothetical protein